jgi:hypothetical protein
MGFVPKAIEGSYRLRFVTEALSMAPGSRLGLDVRDRFTNQLEQPLAPKQNASDLAEAFRVARLAPGHNH